MMSESTKLSNYLKWIAGAYAELRFQQAAHVTHRLLDYHKNKKGEYELSLQLIGKNLIFTAFPKEVLSQDTLLESFSKKDIRLITYLACADAKQNQHEVLGQRFIRSMNKFFFTLKNSQTGQEIEKSAEEISADPSLIKALSPEDAHKIGYTTAGEQIKTERSHLQS